MEVARRNQSKISRISSIWNFQATRYGEIYFPSDISHDFQVVLDFTIHKRSSRAVNHKRLCSFSAPVLDIVVEAVDNRRHILNEGDSLEIHFRASQ